MRTSWNSISGRKTVIGETIHRGVDTAVIEVEGTFSRLLVPLKDLESEILLDERQYESRRGRGVSESKETLSYQVFLDSLTPIQSARAEEALAKQMLYRDVFYTRASLVEKLVGSGWTVDRQFLKKYPVVLRSLEGNFLPQKDLTKTAIDYAEFLSSPRRNGSAKAKSIDRSIKIREAFHDKPHKRQAQVGWNWPTELIEVGDSEAILYTSDKWQKDGRLIDYKHVKEGEQKLLLRSDIALTGDADEMFGPVVDLRGDFPDSFAVLADSISIQAHLYADHQGKTYGDFVDLKFTRSKLGAGRFDDGKCFCFVYDKSGVLAVVVGPKLDVLKDGIVG